MEQQGAKSAETVLFEQSVHSSAFKRGGDARLQALGKKVGLGEYHEEPP